MKNTTHRNIATLLFFIISTFWSHPVFTLSIAPTPSPSNLIDQSCKATKHVDLCKSALAPSPKGEELKNLHDLVTRALEYAADNGTQIESQITKLLKKKRENQFAEQCFQDCSQSYYDAIEQLENSMAALEDKRYDEVREWVEAAISDVESCGDECEGPSPLAKINKRFTKLCGVVLSLVNLLED